MERIRAGVLRKVVGAWWGGDGVEWGRGGVQGRGGDRVGWREAGMMYWEGEVGEEVGVEADGAGCLSQLQDNKHEHA